MVRLGNKHVFWQALVVALIIFWAGIFLGIAFEKTRVEKIETFYFDSETDIFDSELTSEIIFDFDLDCQDSIDKSISFAERIYQEARTLEKYDDSNRIFDELISLHRRYDLLRVMLWKNLIKIKERCSTDINTVVYIYQYIDAPVNTKAIQGTMSNFLLDLKGEQKDKIVLIPIAGDTNVESLNILMDVYGIEKYPVIIVNEDAKFYGLDELANVRNYIE